MSHLHFYVGYFGSLGFLSSVLIAAKLWQVSCAESAHMYVYIHVMGLLKYLVPQPERWKIFFLPIFWLFHVHIFLQMFNLFSLHSISPIWISNYPQFWLGGSFRRCGSSFQTLLNHLDQRVPCYFFSRDLPIHWLAKFYSQHVIEAEVKLHQTSCMKVRAAALALKGCFWFGGRKQQMQLLNEPFLFLKLNGFNS